MKHKNYFFDLDGTLYTGSTAVPYAEQVLGLLRSEGCGIWFLSNNSNQTPEELADKLETMGIAAKPCEFVTPLCAAGEFLFVRCGRSRVYVAGSAALADEVRSAGHQVVTEETSPADAQAEAAYAGEQSYPAAVLLGRDLEFTYNKLERAAKWIQAGAAFFAANADLSHPGERGLAVPETGALAAAVSAVCGAVPEYIGKPEPYLYLRVMKQYGLEPESCLMVGDNPETDGRGAVNAGIDFCRIGGSAVCGREPGGSQTADSIYLAESRQDLSFTDMKELWTYLTKITENE